MEGHAQINNRSLFQVFVDNLIFPQRIQECTANMHGMDSPKTVRVQFAEYVERVNKCADMLFNTCFEEFAGMVDDCNEVVEKGMEDGEFSLLRMANAGTSHESMVEVLMALMKSKGGRPSKNPKFDKKKLKVQDKKEVAGIEDKPPEEYFTYG